MVLFEFFIDFRTVSNCHPAQGNQATKMKPAAAASTPPHYDEDGDVEMGGGDGVVVAEADGASIVDEYTVTPILQVDGEPMCELVDTPKPKKKATKHAWERDEVTANILNILEEMPMMMMKYH